MLTELVSPSKFSLQLTAWLTAICIEKEHSNHAKTFTREDVAKIRIQLPDPMKHEAEGAIHQLAQASSVSPTLDLDCLT